ncbi:MAG: thermonuclease family protein [Phycisphaerae bacterium]|jgi:endonuclease YncB( thermonuclease family)
MLLLLWCGAAAPPDAPPELPGFALEGQTAFPVARIESGLRVVVLADGSERTLRLIGVRGEPDADGRSLLERMLLGESVYVIEPEDRGGGDEGDPLAYMLRAPDGLFVNLELVRTGAAKVEARPPFEHRELFRYYEKRARGAQKGVWAAQSASQPAINSTAAPAKEASPDHGQSGNVAAGDMLVYVTKTGTKYHREGCRHLAKSASAMKLSEARQKFQPCKVCKPPE